MEWGETGLVSQMAPGGFFAGLVGPCSLAARVVPGRCREASRYRRVR